MFWGRFCTFFFSLYTHQPHCKHFWLFYSTCKTDWMSSVVVCPMPLNTSDNYYACKWKCYSSIASCCFTRIRVWSTGQRMFFNCSIYIYIRKHFNWQWLSFPASHPLSPAPTCTLAFWSITSTITDYSTERAVTPPSSTSPHSHPPTYPGWHSNLPVTFCIFNCCACL